MRRKRFAEERIALAVELHQAEARTPVEEICRRQASLGHHFTVGRSGGRHGDTREPAICPAMPVQALSDPRRPRRGHGSGASTSFRSSWKTRHWL